MKLKGDSTSAKCKVCRPVFNYLQWVDQLRKIIQMEKKDLSKDKAIKNSIKLLRRSPNKAINKII